MDLRITGIIIGTIGKVLIAYMALMVHHRVKKEHQIDNLVFKIMQRV